MRTTPKLKIIKLFPTAQIPQKKHRTDSGFDLFVHHFEQCFFVDRSCSSAVEKSQACTDSEAVEVRPGQRVLVHTGISATVGEGYELQVRARSGLAIKKGLAVLNAPGTIDAEYRGPICVIAINCSSVPQKIEKGMRIAQLVVSPVILADIEEVSSLDQTVRGEGGFGSTGD